MRCFLCIDFLRCLQSRKTQFPKIINTKSGSVLLVNIIIFRVRYLLSHVYLSQIDAMWKKGKGHKIFLGC